MSTEDTSKSPQVSSTDAVDFYWRPGCPFCIRLRRQLARTDIPIREINIWQEPEAAARVRAVASGNETVPTVFVGKHAMVNPGRNEVIEAVRTYAPEVLPPEPEQRRRSRRWLPWR